MSPLSEHDWEYAYVLELFYGQAGLSAVPDGCVIEGFAVVHSSANKSPDISVRKNGSVAEKHLVVFMDNGIDTRNRHLVNDLIPRLG